MKIRSGFVSNSSSSSFVIVTTPEAWKAAKKKLAEKVGENVAFVIVSELGRPEEANILGQNALILSGVLSSEEYGCTGIARLKDIKNLTEEEEENLAMEAYDKQSELDEILRNDGISYTSSEGC